MKVVFFGTPTFAVPSLARLIQHPDFTVQGVVTQPDKRRGRGGQLSPSPVKAIAIDHQLPSWQPPRLKKDPATIAQLADLQADAFVVVAYGQILSPEILALPRLGCINAHGSILPRYRGAAPIQWSVCHGATETGITTMLMDAGMDTGPMLLKATTPIALLENAHDLAERLAHMSADLLVQTLLQLAAGDLTPEPQDETQATYAPLIQKADYELVWERPAIALHNQVRGFFPGCVTQFRGDRLKVLATVPLQADCVADLPTEYQALQANFAEWTARSAVPGTVIATLRHLGPVVQTGAGWVLLQEVQPAGKKRQSGWDFANGLRVEPGELIGATA